MLREIDAAYEMVASQIVEAVGEYFKADDALWKVADLLVKLCGEPGPNGAHNGSMARLKKVAALLKTRFGKQAGQFGHTYLERLRSVAARFPPHTRVGGVAFNVHWAAGDPETLQLAQQEAANRRVTLTVAFVKEFKARQSETSERDGTNETSRPDWITAAHELRGIAADTAGQAEDLEQFLQRHCKELTRVDVKMLIADFVEVRLRLNSACNSVDASVRRLQSTEAAA